MITESRIYIASPYTDNVELSYAESSKLTSLLLNNEKVPFCPNLYFHNIAVEHNLPTTWEFWNRQCTEYLEHFAEAMILILLYGKDLPLSMELINNSTGVTNEINIAYRNNLPIYLYCPVTKTFTNYLTQAH